MKKQLARAAIEIAFIVFLFYANLLMGEFERSGFGTRKGIYAAVNDMLTATNFEIALVAAVVGYLLFESLRKKS